MTAVAEETERLYFSPLGLYNFQITAVVHCYERLSNLCVYDTGLGKAEPVSEPVLTPAGWRTMGDLRVGDHVIGSDGLPTEVLGVYPQGVQPVWRVTLSDGTYVRCNSEHLWAVRTKVHRYRNQDFRVLTTEEIAASIHRDWQLPIVAPVQHLGSDLPIEPYALGAILGDGWVDDSGHVQVTSDQWVLREIGLSPAARAGCFVGSSSRWASALKEMDLAGCKAQDKFVPSEYMVASEQDRRALLAGLLDTDGHAMEKGGAEFSSTSRALVDAVCELVRSLGGVARGLRLASSTYTYKGERRQGQTAWRVNLKIDGNPFRLPRKADQYVVPTKYPCARIIRSVEPEGLSEEQVCIRVASPDSLYVTRDHIVTHNTHIGMATSAMLFEDAQIDHVLLVCEKNKIEEWQADFATFTALDAALYYGTPAKRTKIREALPQVLISTYETARNDAVTSISVPKRKTKKLVPHVLTEALSGKRVLVIYDEMTKLGNRGSGLHKAHEMLVSTIRASGACRVLGLTATPIERSPEDFYNLGRILCPEAVGTVAEFERCYIKARDIFGNASAFQNLSPADCDPGVIPFSERLKPVLLRKRKTDPDVIDEFPSSVEEFTYVDLEPKHLEFYDAVRDAFEDADEMTQKVLFTTMRQIVAHPLALLHSQGEIGRTIVNTVGVEGLAALGSAKTERLAEYLAPIVLGQGDQVVVFTFFGPSVIPLLRDVLEDKGISCALNYGGLSDADRARDKALFKQGSKRVLLTSDAGARGINLPEANYVVEYEMALTHANRTQRLNRIHRIDSRHPSVTFQTFIARDTVEEGIARKVLQRNDWADMLLDDDDPGENFVSAADRRALMARAKRSGRL